MTFDFKRTIKAFEDTSGKEVEQLNSALMAASVDPAYIGAGIVLVTNDYYSDPDAFVNKFEVWATEFEKLTGLGEHFWFWKNHPVSSKDLEDLFNTDKTNGNWTIAFYGTLFQKRNGLGALILNAEDGKMGYIVTSFAPGFRYSTNSVKLPDSVKRGKDLARMVAEATPSWISDLLLDRYDSVGACSIRRHGKEFIFDLEPSGEAINMMAVGRSLKDMEFKIQSTDIDSETGNVHIVATHDLKLFQNF